MVGEKSYLKLDARQALAVESGVAQPFIADTERQPVWSCTTKVLEGLRIAPIGKVRVSVTLNLCAVAMAEPCPVTGVAAYIPIRLTRTA